MNHPKTLHSLHPEESAMITTILTTCPIRQRLLDIGFVNNAVVRCLFASPAKDPVAYLICGSVIALREETSEKIIIQKLKGLMD